MLIKLEDLRYISIQLLKNVLSQPLKIIGEWNLSSLDFYTNFGQLGYGSKLHPKIPLKLEICSNMHHGSFSEILKDLWENHKNVNIIELESFYFITQDTLPLFEDFLDTFDELNKLKIKVMNDKTMKQLLKMLHQRELFEIAIEYHGPTVNLRHVISSFINEYYDKKISVHCMQINQTLQAKY